MTSREQRSVAVALAMAFAGCSFNFDRPSEVIDRRILALRVEPPEAVFPPKPGFKVQLSALVVEPTGDDPVVPYVWRACLVNQSIGGGGGFGGGSSAKLCPEDETRIELKSGEGPLSELSTPFALGPEALTLLQGGATSFKQLQVELEVEPGDASLQAVKKLAVGFAAPGADAPNLNPVLTSLRFDGIEWPEGVVLPVTYGNCVEEATEKVQTGTGTPTFSFGSGRAQIPTVTVCNRDFIPNFDDAQAQTYTGLGTSGDVQTLKERLRFSWFADVGHFARETTAQADPNFSFGNQDGPATKWREPLAKTDSVITFWIVVRDGRGGETWYKRQLQFL